MGLVFIGFFSGVISGMGIGGGAILVPALSLFTNFTQQQAQGINLLVFIPASIVALTVHKKQGNIDKKGTTPLILFGLVGAVGGSLFALYLDQDFLRKIFATFLLIAGLLELWQARRARPKDHTPHQ